MGKKLLSVTVKGKHKTWSFDFYGDPQYIQEWLDDGLDIVVICNTVPVWVAKLGLVREWCFIQDLFNFKNPFAK